MAATNPITKKTMPRPERPRSAPISDEPTKAELMEDIRLACSRQRLARDARRMKHSRKSAGKSQALPTRVKAPRGGG